MCMNEKLHFICGLKTKQSLRGYKNFVADMVGENDYVIFTNCLYGTSKIANHAYILAENSGNDILELFTGRRKYETREADTPRVPMHTYDACAVGSMGRLWAV